jgi:hypothetical protein
MNRTLHLIVLLLLAGIFSSCLKIGEMYVGLNLQPDMENSPFEPGLNVFGVLKSGPDFDTLNHRFEVQQLLEITNLEEALEVDSAEIVLIRETDGGEQSFYKPQHHTDGLYFDQNIITAPGDKWEFICTYDTFQVTASSIVPQTPVVNQQSIEISVNEVVFSVLADPTAFLYAVYLFQGENYFIMQTVPDGNYATSISLKPEWQISDEKLMLYVFACDKNLRQYYTTSNTFFKPNAFRPLFTTVNGGYGVFGATSSTAVVLQ